MKKIISLLAAAVLSSSAAVSAFAEGDVKIMLNGEEFVTDVAPFIENNRTMVPARAIFEAMGARVNWDEEKKTVLMLRQNGDELSSVVLQIGLDKAFVNNEAMPLDAPAKIVQNRTFVPLRFIIEAFGEDITWDGDQRVVSINYQLPIDE